MVQPMCQNVMQNQMQNQPKYVTNLVKILLIIDAPFAPILWNVQNHFNCYVYVQPRVIVYSASLET